MLIRHVAQSPTCVSPSPSCELSPKDPDFTDLGDDLMLSLASYHLSPHKIPSKPQISPQKGHHLQRLFGSEGQIQREKQASSGLDQRQQREGRVGSGIMRKSVEGEGGAAGVRVRIVNAGFDGEGVEIPYLGLGVYQMPAEATVQAVTLALQHGYRHIDTAHLYGNERSVGLAIRQSGIPREEIFVTTKLWNSDHGYQNTLEAFDRSLRQLGLDYVDLYLVHSPMPKNLRLKSWDAMESILKSGKAKSIGVSNYGIHHLKELFGHAKIKPSVNQLELHPFNTRMDLVQFCEKENIVLEAYSPLTRGQRMNHPALVEIAKHYEKSPAQILIRWAVQKNFVVLPKSVTPLRIVENAQVFDFEISSSDMAKLDSLNENLTVGWDPTTAS